MKSWHNHRHTLLILIALSLIAGACSPVPGSQPASITVLPSASVIPSPWLQIYFTDPSAPNAHSYEGGPDKTLADAIDGARFTVDVAIYSLNLWSIRDALIHAHQRGVVVRMVMESDNMDNQEVQDLKDAGVPIFGDQREGLMHNKFMVIDRSAVWTGSLNYTISGTYEDNNNLICIRSDQVAEDYTSEFNDMFENNLFGAMKVNAPPHPRVTIEGTPLEIYFSPNGGVAKRILELVNGAQDSIYFLAYTFTSHNIGAAMIDRAKAGVKVSGVMDKGQITSSAGNEYDQFMQAGLNVRKDGIDGLMHHKVIIIDRKIVITGSYNFTNSAETTNDENVVILFSPDVVAQYLQEFQKVYNQAQP